MFRSNLILVIICLLLTNIMVFGQRQVTGRVIDMDTKKPIADAKVKIASSNTETATNVLGFFQLNVDTTDYLLIERNDYEIVQIKIPSVDKFQINLTKISTPKEERTYTIVEQMPVFPGGANAFLQYISKNLRYPSDARNIKGTVLVDFIIDTTGVVLPESVMINKGLYKSCDEEVIRLIKGSPNWIPGRQNNKAVRVRFVLPVKFK